MSPPYQSYQPQVTPEDWIVTIKQYKITPLICKYDGTTIFWMEVGIDR